MCVVVLCGDFRRTGKANSGNGSILPLWRRSSGIAESGGFFLPISRRSLKLHHTFEWGALRGSTSRLSQGSPARRVWGRLAGGRGGAGTRKDDESGAVVAEEISIFRPRGPLVVGGGRPRRLRRGGAERGNGDEEDAEAERYPALGDRSTRRMGSSPFLFSRRASSEAW